MSIATEYVQDRGDIPGQCKPNIKSTEQHKRQLTLNCDRCCVTSCISHVIGSHAAEHQHGISSEVFSGKKAEHTSGGLISLETEADVEKIVVHYGSAIAEFPGDVWRGCGLGGASQDDDVVDDC